MAHLNVLAKTRASKTVMEIKIRFAVTVKIEGDRIVGHNLCVNVFINDLGLGGLG